MTPLNPKTTDITEAAVEGDPAVRRALWQELVAAQQKDDQRAFLDRTAEEEAAEAGVPLEQAQGWLAAALWAGGMPAIVNDRHVRPTTWPAAPPKRLPPVVFRRKGGRKS